MANHALPITTSLYTDVLANLKDRIDDSLKMLDSVNTTPTNVPTNSVRFNSTTFLWEKYNGSSWVSLASIYGIQVSKSINLTGGNSTTLLGAIHYQSNTDTSSILSPNTTTTRKFLRQTGTGTNGAAPVWDTILASDIPVLNYISKITSVDNHLVRFDGVSGEVQGSGVVVDDSGIMTVTSASGGIPIKLKNTSSETCTATFEGSTTTTPVILGCFGNEFYINLGGSERLRMNSSGNLGLGVTPSPWYTGAKVIDINTNASILSDSGSLYILQNAYNDGTWRYKTTGFASNYYQSKASGSHFWQVAPSGTAGSAMNLTTAMTLTTGGNLSVLGNVTAPTFIGNLSGNATTATTANNGSKAWVNFNGTGTVAIRASFNISSITDNGTGDYTVNFSNAMVDANYSMVGISKAQATGAVSPMVFEEHFDTSPTTSAIRINIKQTNIKTDSSAIHLAIFR